MWFIDMGCYIRCLAVEHTRRGAIEDVDRCRHILTLEVAGQPIRLEHASSHGDHALIPPLHNPILLRGVGGGELALDAALGAVALELHGGEFTSPISTEHLQLLPGLHFDGGLEILDLRWRLILAREESDLHVPAHVINKKQEVLVTTRCHRGDGAAQVTVNQLKSRLCSPSCLSRERRTTLFAN
jgi:hypothetical protein